MLQSVLVTQDRAARIVTLNRPKALNSLNAEMVEAMLPLYQSFRALPPRSVVVLLKGSGEKAFCAGGDVVSIVKDQPAGTQQHFFYREYQLDYSIMTLPQAHVSLWDGIVMGGGVGISVHGAHRVASQKAVFAMPETAIGLFPDVGGSWFLPRLPVAGLGLFLALTGQRLKGGDLLHAGIATDYVPTDRMAELEQALCALEPSGPAGGIDAERVSRVIRGFAPATLPEFSLAAQLPAIQKLFAPEAVPTVEALLLALERDGSEWALKQLVTLRKCSPTSLKLSLRLYNEGRAPGATAESIFRLEYFASQRMMELPDFKAGVSALLIDKTGALPVWSPARVEDVTDQLVASCLAPSSLATPTWQPTGDFPAKSNL